MDCRRRRQISHRVGFIFSLCPRSVDAALSEGRAVGPECHTSQGPPCPLRGAHGGVIHGSWRHLVSSPGFRWFIIVPVTISHGTGSSFGVQIGV